MDPAPVILVILGINLAVFLGGCALAGYRTWRDAHPAQRRRARQHTPVGRPSH